MCTVWMQEKHTTCFRFLLSAVGRPIVLYVSIGDAVGLSPCFQMQAGCIAFLGNYYPLCGSLHLLTISAISNPKLTCWRQGWQSVVYQDPVLLPRW